MRILAVADKELRQILRDPLTLVMLLGLPAFLLVMFGYAISFDVENVPLGVQDRDRSRDSRELVAAFVSSGRFNLVAELDTPEAVDVALETGRVVVALVIPEGFSRDLAAGHEVSVQLLLDGTDSNKATTVMGYANGIIGAANRYRRGKLLGARTAAAGVAFEPRVFYNPELESTRFLLPGLIGFILMIIAVLSTALSLVREAERGTLEQLQVAPVRTPEILIGKILPYLVINFVGVILILICARILFDVHVRGSYLDLFLVTLLYLLAGISFGLLVSTVAKTQAVAFDIGVMTSLLPTLLLTGFIFPIHNMPRALQLLSYLIPGRYYIVILRGIILKGAALSSYLDQLGSLALYTVVVLTLASVRFSRRAV